MSCFEWQSTIEPIGRDIPPLGDGWEFRGAFIRPGNAAPGEFVARLALWRRRVVALAALLSLGCGDPGSVGDGYTGMLCGFMEVPESPFTNETAGCERVRVVAPAGLLVSSIAATACDVSQAGVQCLIVRPGEQFRLWRPSADFGAEWDASRDPVDCTEVCP